MSEEPIETIRETSRYSLVLNRRKVRDEEADTRRAMKNLNISSDTVQNIANKLKTKSSVNISELQTLKNALIDDVNNIEVVLNTHGALRGLVREMTGHEVNKQCAAAGCCCNLALGDSRAGIAVVKAAGPYLVTALDNLTTELAVTSAWTLGNLAGSGPKACEMLIAQGAMAKLIELLDNSNEEMRDAVLYALVRFAYQLKDDLRPEHLQKIFQTLPQDINSTSQLLFILSCHSAFSTELLSEQLLKNILQYLTTSSNNESITYLYRFLANINCKEVYSIVLKFFVDNNMVGNVKSLCENESVIWFLGNAMNLCGDHVFFEMLLR
ncbi:uncharacterized protein LOC142977563 [Anticarsia gemmatalis]|uniref:uncharacterized protein LOC142977563 n=1 Tax=Anticarsia gemmatalis TaxID=129554 RepID=UPI003F76F3D7